MKEYILSIDIGTSSCKTVLLDASGEAAAAASREYGARYAPDGSAEEDARDWWRGVVETVTELADKRPDCTRNIIAVGVDAQSSVMLPVDECGEPLSPAMIWNDHRAQAQADKIDRDVGQDTLSRINGNHNAPSNVAPKIMWLRDERSDVYRSADKIVSAVGFIVNRLTGEHALNLSEGGLTQLIDIEKGVWSDELISGCGLDRGKLPELCPCDHIVGRVTAEASRLLNIPEGVPVVAGAMDACACALGTGVTRRGDAFVTGGTVTALGVASDRPVRNGSLHVYHHVVPGLWASVGGVDFGGGSFRWYRDQFLQGVEKPYDRMNALAAEAQAGCRGLLFLPSLVGQRCPQWDGDMRGSYVGVTPNHGQREFIRAIMEGNAYGVREIMEIQLGAGAAIDRIMIAGGIATSELWMNIFASVLDRAIYRVHSRQDTAYGNLLCAGVGVGLYKSYDVTLAGRSFEPIADLPETREVYNKYYNIYKKLYPALKEIFSDLARAERE